MVKGVLNWYGSLVRKLCPKDYYNLGAIIDYCFKQSKVVVIDLSQGKERQITYKQLDDLSNAVARALYKKNIPRGSKIAIIADNSSEYIASYFGILRAGMVAVLINHKLPQDKIKIQLEHSGSVLIFCDKKRKLSLQSSTPEIVCFEEDFENWIDFGPFKAVRPHENESAVIIYTSGSTSDGLKGVVITHQAHIWMLKKKLPEGKYKRWLASENFRQILAAPMYHMGGLSSVETVIMGYGTIVLLPHYDSETFARAIEKYKVVSVKAVPPMLAMLLSNHDLLENVDLSSVQVIHLGGAPLTQTLCEKINRHFLGIEGRIVNAYGVTEVGSSLFQGSHPEEKPVPQLSVGYPRAGIEYRIIDGVLQVRTPSMLKEYLNNPDKFKSSLTDDGFFITNDLFHMDENGFYFCDGRVDDVFVSGGENIFPSEIEQVIESFPGVEVAVVVPVDDEIKGTKPYAFVIMNHKNEFSEEEIKKYLLPKVTSYQLPKRIWKIIDLPLTNTGKIDRRSLIENAKAKLDSDYAR